MKPLFVISCPIDTYSGYGARSRDLVKSIIGLNKYDVKILPQRWGNTPWDYIKDHPEWEFLIPHILPDNNLPKKPNVWAQVTVPNEFQPLGEFNIGFTAGIETTSCHTSWLEGLNRMDLNIVSSNHAKVVFENTQYEKRHPQTNQSLGILKLEKPVKVLFEGMDLEKFKPLTAKERDTSIVKELNDIPEKFAYLFVGHWLQGDIGEDRKNVGLTIKAFFEVFKNKTNTPALVLKASTGGCSYMDRERVLDKINHIRKEIKAKSLPNVYLLHGEFNENEINHLYNHPKIKAMINLTKGEGFGRPLLEFSLVNKPIIASKYSGHLDFLDQRFTPLVEGELTPVHNSAVVKDMILKESQWFSPNVGEIGHYLKDVFENYSNYTKGAKLQYHKSKNNFSFEQMTERINSYFELYLPTFPEQIGLQLPNIANLELPQLQQL